MLLQIDLDKPEEIAKGFWILQALATSAHAAQQAKLNPQAAAQPEPAAKAEPIPTPAQTEAAVMADKAVAKISAEAEAEATASKARRGRPPAPEKAAKPPKAPKPMTAKQAAAIPVGVALRGVPAHDLAAALGDDPEPEPEVEEAAVAEENELDDLVFVDDENAEAEAAAVDPVPEQPAEKSGSLDDLFAAPKKNYDAMSLEQLVAEWREEGAKRGIHWLRALIEQKSLKSPNDLTREMIIEAMKNPDVYAPPVAA
jgi:hypothetical protein